MPKIYRVIIHEKDNPDKDIVQDYAWDETTPVHYIGAEISDTLKVLSNQEQPNF